MTKEEAKKILVFQSNHKHNSSTIPQTVDEIYDDFESRICENCEHWSEEKKQCFNEESIAFTSQEAIYCDDGCNKFKRKTDEH